MIHDSVLTSTVTFRYHFSFFLFFFLVCIASFLACLSLRIVTKQVTKYAVITGTMLIYNYCPRFYESFLGKADGLGGRQGDGAQGAIGERQGDGPGTTGDGTGDGIGGRHRRRQRDLDAYHVTKSGSTFIYQKLVIWYYLSFGLSK